jgi:hypothetical protein
MQVRVAWGGGLLRPFGAGSFLAIHRYSFAAARLDSRRRLSPHSLAPVKSDLTFATEP